MHDRLEIILPPNTEDIDLEIHEAMYWQGHNIAGLTFEYFNIGGRWHGHKKRGGGKIKNASALIQANTAPLSDCLDLQADTVMIVVDSTPIFLINKVIYNGVGYNEVSWDKTLKGAITIFKRQLNKELKYAKYLLKVTNNDSIKTRKNVMAKHRQQVARELPHNEWLTVTVDYKR